MMEKKKLLLFGANESLLSDFFAKLPVRFEMLSCSSREEDILGHIKYFDPDALVLCLYNERRDDFQKLDSVRKALRKRGSVLIVAGDGIKCDEFERQMPNAADYIARRSRTNTCQVMGMQIDSYLESMSSFRRNKRKVEPIPDDDLVIVPTSPVLSAHAKSGGGESLEELLAAAAEAVNEMAAMPAQRTPGERRHVLVVDDDSSMLRMIKDILGEHYDVAAAINGKVALKFLETRRTDLILLDYEMPGQSGADVYEKILENPALRHIPVVFLTGVSDRERIATVLAMRPRGYLLKPIDSERLKKTVEEIVG